MRIILSIFAVLIFIKSQSIAQVNYVLNPDFEQHTQCPSNNDQILFASYWSSIDSSTNFNYCIPDYCHTCATPGNVVSSVPASGGYWQYPHSGKGMAKMGMYNDESSSFDLNKRDYLQGRLSSPLSKGKSY